MLRGLAAVGFWLLALWLLAFQKIGYQGRGDFRGRGNLLLMVENLLGRCLAPAQKWYFNLWPAVVCVLLVLFSSLSSSRLSFFSSAEFSAAGSWAAPSVRSLARKLRPRRLSQRASKRAAKRAVKSAAGLALIWALICTGTGTSGGGLCLGENRRRGCGFGLISRRWQCGRRAWLHLHLHLGLPPQTHSSQRAR